MNEIKFSFYKIMITQLCAAILLLLLVLGIKLFSKKEYTQIKEFYKQELLSETSVEEVLEREG